MRYLLLLLLARLCAAQLLLNEYLSNPLGSEYEDECVELWNPGASAVSLDDLRLSDGSGIDELVSDADSLPPGQIALILDPDHSGAYLQGLPDSVVVLYIGDTSFGSGGLTNGGGECLQLLSAEGEVLDSLWTRGDLPAGCSCERRERDPCSSASWLPHRLGSHSLGRPNSVQRLDYELELLEIKLERLLLRACGYAGWSGPVTLCAGQGSCALETELVLPDLNGGECWEQTLPPLPLAGNNPFHLSHPSPGGSRLLLDTLLWRPARDGLCINEIMADGEEGRDWIELWNAGECELVLDGMELVADSWSQELEGTLAAACYLLLGRDTQTREDCRTFVCAPHLNLQGFLVLESPDGERVEEVQWDTPVHCRARSLERLGPELQAELPESWSCSSVTGGTPGGQNSCWIPSADRAGLQLSSDLLLPLSTNENAHLRISCPGSERLVIQLWTRLGERLFERYTESSSYLWNGRLENGQLPEPGAYLLRVHTGSEWEMRAVAVSW